MTTCCNERMGHSLRHGAGTDENRYAGGNGYCKDDFVGAITEVMGVNCYSVIQRCIGCYKSDVG